MPSPKKWSDESRDDMLFDEDYDDFMDYLIELHVVEDGMDSLNEVAAMLLFVCKQYQTFQVRVLNKRSPSQKRAHRQSLN